MTGAATISLPDSGGDTMKQGKSADDDLLKSTIADFERSSWTEPQGVNKKLVDILCRKSYILTGRIRESRDENH
ncbi:MAG: hypothetical protein V2A66_02640 [Pseudomonadota bacterium]